MTPARHPVLAVTDKVGTCRQESTIPNFFADNLPLTYLPVTFGAFGRRVKRNSRGFFFAAMQHSGFER
jgi:hypothetical protein